MLNKLLLIKPSSYRSFKDRAKSARKSAAPSPVFMLAVQAIRVDNRGLMFAEILKGTKSHLLNKNKVSEVISEPNDCGRQMRGPSDVCSMTSGKDSTHIETFADLTLEGKADQPSHDTRQRGTDVFSARWTPILSTKSSVFRKPAVSATMTGRPPISRDSSMTSLVVPGTGVTIAASRCANWEHVRAYR